MASKFLNILMYWATFTSFVLLMDSSPEPSTIKLNVSHRNLYKISNSTSDYGREGKLIFRRVWSWPRKSPLYLINGTVCRFFNGVPICTTLSTTGLLPNTGSRLASSGLMTSAVMSGNQGAQSSVEYANQGGVRPNDELMLVNSVQGTNNSLDRNQPQRQVQAQQPLSTVYIQRQPIAFRPFLRVPMRPLRPMNYLQLTRN